MAQVVGSIAADLRLESAAFIRDMTKAAQATQKSASSMQRSMAGVQKTFASVATSLKGTIGAFISIAGVRAFSSLVSSATKFADSIGDTSAALGIGAEALQRYRVAGELADVSIEQMDTALKLFQKSLATGKIKDASFEDFIQRIREAPSQIEKVKIAQEGLSKQFQVGILLAQQSAEEFRKNFQNAATVSQQALDNADTLTKQFGLLQDTLAKGFAEGFLESFGFITNDMKLTTEQLETFKRAAEGLGALSGKIVTWLGSIATAFANTGTAIADAIPKLRDYVIALRDANAEQMRARGQDPDAFLPPIRDVTPDVPTFGASQGGRRGGLPVAQQAAADAQAEAEARKQAIAQIEQEKSAKERLAAATRLANQAKQEEQAMIAATRTPYEEYLAVLKEIDATQKSTAEASVAAARAQQQAALNLASTYINAAAQVTGTLASAFQDNKAFAIANAVMNVAQGITQALTLPFPLNWAQVAAVTAAGIAQIANIRSARPGSSSTAKASSGGKGARASSRETTGVEQSTLAIQIRGEGFLSRVQLENVMQQIVDAQRDGAKIVLATP